MPLDKSLVIDKSVFPLGVTCVAVALGNASILRSRSEFILGKPAFLLLASWRSRHILSVVPIRFGNASLTFQSQPQRGFMSP